MDWLKQNELLIVTIVNFSALRVQLQGHTRRILPTWAHVGGWHIDYITIVTFFVPEHYVQCSSVVFDTNFIELNVGGLYFRELPSRSVFLSNWHRCFVSNFPVAGGRTRTFALLHGLTVYDLILIKSIKNNLAAPLKIDILAGTPIVWNFYTVETRLARYSLHIY